MVVSEAKPNDSGKEKRGQTLEVSRKLVKTTVRRNKKRNSHWLLAICQALL